MIMNEENNNIEKNGSEQPSQPQVNEKIKYILIAIAAALVVIVAVLVLFFSSDDSGNTANNSSTSVSEQQSAQDETDTSEDQQNGQEAQEPEKTYTPVFMYFVSKSDEGYDEYMSMIEELKAEYSDKVTFDIVDVDEEPESKENFPVDGNTPMLIMTNTSNDISALEFKCSDKARLAEDIEKSIGSQQ